jgi:hypothetical protein
MTNLSHRVLNSYLLTNTPPGSNIHEPDAPDLRKMGQQSRLFHAAGLVVEAV